MQEPGPSGNPACSFQCCLELPGNCLGFSFYAQLPLPFDFNLSLVDALKALVVYTDIGNTDYVFIRVK